MKSFNIRKTWTPDGDALYALTIADETYTAIETAGDPLAIDGAVDIADNLTGDLTGIDFTDESTFAEAADAILTRDDRLSAPISLSAITSEGVKRYFKAIIATLLDDDAATDAELAENLSALRRRAGFSQSGLAEAAGIKLNTLQHLESGVNRLLGAKLEIVLAIARALGVTVEELVEID